MGADAQKLPCLPACLPAGNLLRSDVVGKIVMKCYLSDMPELRLGLNDKIEDVTFHQCVNLPTYEAQKVVTFVPPDGEVELMRCVRAAPGSSAATAPDEDGPGSHMLPRPNLHGGCSFVMHVISTPLHDWLAVLW